MKKEQLKINWKLAFKFEAEYFQTKTAPNWFKIIKEKKINYSIFFFEVPYFDFIIIEISMKTEYLIMLSMLVFSNKDHFQMIFLLIRI